MKRSRRYQQIKKIASKVGQKGAKGMNFDHAQNQLSEASPGTEFSRDEITRKVSEEPLFSQEALDSIFKIEIEPHHTKMMNKAEKAFIEIGAFLTEKEDHIQEIGDYLSGENAQPGWIEERYDVSLQTLRSVIENFNQLDQAQRQAHEEAARKDAEAVSEAGKFGNGYETNEVVYEFEDGWKVVYVPAIGEGPNYKGNPGKSNDRTIEGNINGLCLGATQGLYQGNDMGKIYSVRDPGNNPQVTIRIFNRSLEEAKGKQNRPPDVEGAIHADEWFKIQEDSLDYRNSLDYKKFPPLTKDDAIRKFNENPEDAYEKGWVVSWFRRGVSEIDKDIFRRIKAKDILIVYSGLGKKYKELAQPVVKYWAEKWNNESSSEIWGNLKPKSIEQLSHESWKTYKKEPWMKAASEKLIMEESEFAFEIGLQRINEYKDAAEIPAGSLVEKDPYKFFVLKLHETYPELGRPAAESLAGKEPYEFFHHKLHKTYPELGRIHAEYWAVEEPDKFFEFSLHETYPEFVRPARHETYSEMERPEFWAEEDEEDNWADEYDLRIEELFAAEKIDYLYQYQNILLNDGVNINDEVGGDGKSIDKVDRLAKRIAEVGSIVFYEADLTDLDLTQKYSNIWATNFIEKNKEKENLSRNERLALSLAKDIVQDTSEEGIMEEEEDMVIDKMSSLIIWLSKSGHKKEAADILSLYKEASIKIKMSPIEVAVALGLLSEKALIGDDKKESKSKKEDKKEEEEVIKYLLKELREFDLEKEAAKKKKKSKKKKDRTPTKPELWSASKAWAKRKYDVWPSAYAVGAALKRYKEKGGGWRGPKPKK